MTNLDAILAKESVAVQNAVHALQREPSYSVRNFVWHEIRRRLKPTWNQYIWGPSAPLVPEIHFTSFIRHLATTAPKSYGDPQRSWIAEALRTSNA